MTEVKHALQSYATFTDERVNVLFPIVVTMPQLANLLTVFSGLLLKARKTVKKLGMSLS